MATQFDLLIRNGSVVDGTGAEAFTADIGVSNGRISAVQKNISGGAREEIDADGLLVTPGFVDVHTHFDGHVTWENRPRPSTGHGVTTIVVGNCGVGFAPCKPEDRDFLIGLMETVEDIPFADLKKGLPWDWESFPEYIDAIGRRRYNMDVGTLVPHSTLRAYVMGKRALSGEPATAEDIATMAALTRDAVKAGALGFGTTILREQRTNDGNHIPSYYADEAEFTAIAQGMQEAGGGVFQIAPEFNEFPLALDQLDMLVRVGKASGRPLMYSLKQSNSTTTGWQQMLEISDRANRNGVRVHPQVFGRPTGAILSLESSLHPFSRCPSFAPLLTLPLAEKVRALQNADLKARLIEESKTVPISRRANGYRLVFPLSDPPNYEPTIDESLDARAALRGMAPEALAYELLLENSGNGLLLLAGGNYADSNLEPSFGMLQNANAIPGLGDGGAHSAIICDASISTFMLSYWTRDRTRGAKLSLPHAVKLLTSASANAIGLHDRGVIKSGYKADINVIDYKNLTLRAPYMTYDLPAGGRRFAQKAEGYVATILSGEIVHRHDRETDKLPGRVLRGAQAAPT
jgi:N-acyl-D-aspartate/D-glutamate deacylase